MDKEFPNLQDKRYNDILANGWRLASSRWMSLPEFTKEFAYIELGGRRTPEVYAHRIKQIGFVGLDSVLDAGCGIGQWSIVLSRHNRCVVSGDVDEGRIEFARGFAQDNGADSVRFYCKHVEETGLAAESVDGVLCYGVFMFSDMSETIAEFRRILKPGGRVYVNANTWGWYVHLVVDRCIRNRTFMVTRGYTTAERRAWLNAAFRYFRRYMVGANSHTIVTVSYLKKLLSEQNGFSIVALNHEGGITVQSNVHPMPFYPPRFYGMSSTIEVLATRN